MLKRYHRDPLTRFIQDEVTPALGIIPKGVKWSSQSAAVFEHLSGDFMTSVVGSVDKLLASGQFLPTQNVSSVACGLSVIILNSVNAVYSLRPFQSALCVENSDLKEWSQFASWQASLDVTRSD